MYEVDAFLFFTEAVSEKHTLSAPRPFGTKVQRSYWQQIVAYPGINLSQSYAPLPISCCGFHFKGCLQPPDSEPQPQHPQQAANHISNHQPHPGLPPKHNGFIRISSRGLGQGLYHRDSHQQLCCDFLQDNLLILSLGQECLWGLGNPILCCGTEQEARRATDSGSAERADGELYCE